MKRREFLKILIAGGAGTLFRKTFAQKNTLLLQMGRDLPPMQINPFSSEVVLNSRLSYHDGFSGTLSDQILANVLWATARAPLIGSSRIIYVALPDNVYTYDPDQHELLFHKSGNHISEPELAFEVGIASELVEDAGTALHYAHLAAISFWTGTSNQPICVPQRSATIHANGNWDAASTIHLVNSYGRMGTVRGITDELVAESSDGSLPDPSTDGTVLLENALSNLIYGAQFDETELTLEEISQLAWASYGCTPHTTYNGRDGLTVASAYANYYLTRRIYIVRREGVERYHNRLPSGGLNTQDHRIERETEGDRRPQLRDAIFRLPDTAPNYFVYCAENADTYPLLEASFCGASALLQTTSLNRQGFLTADFTEGERSAIINALDIPPDDLPLVIFSAGHKDTGIKGKSSSSLLFHETKPNPFVDKTKIKYGLTSSAHVKLSIYDTTGRRMKILVNQRQSNGNHSVTWNGTDAEGKKLPAGSYYYILEIDTKEYKRKVIKA